MIRSGETSGEWYLDKKILLSGWSSRKEAFDLYEKMKAEHAELVRTTSRMNIATLFFHGVGVACISIEHYFAKAIGIVAFLIGGILGVIPTKKVYRREALLMRLAKGEVQAPEEIKIENISSVRNTDAVNPETVKNTNLQPERKKIHSIDSYKLSPFKKEIEIANVSSISMTDDMDPKIFKNSNQHSEQKKINSINSVKLPPFKDEAPIKPAQTLEIKAK